MSEPDYAALGRYVHLEGLVAQQIAARNQLLERAATLLSNGTKPPVGLNAAPARRFNFEAARKLLADAEQAEAKLLELVAEANDLAPLAGKPGLKVE